MLSGPPDDQTDSGTIQHLEDTHLNQDVTNAIEIEDCHFWSGPGMKLAARVYRPVKDSAATESPALVFCHGFGGTKEGTPPGLASRLAQHGFCVLTFDYRGQGGSDGPKGRLVPREQIEDAVHAVEFLARYPGVDPQRIAIYGTSFGGGIAAMAARRSPRVKAVVMTVPVTSGTAWLRSMMRHYEFEDLRARAYAAIGDKTQTGQFAMVDRLEIMVPDPETQRRYPGRVEMTLENVYHILDYEAIAEAEQLQVPVLVMTVAGDVLVPADHARAYVERLRVPNRLKVFPIGNHFTVYDDLLESVAGETLRWFDEHMAVNAKENDHAI
jgi:dipeptidyl aminopeptidase/acylaminoacyl peptidase